MTAEVLIAPGFADPVFQSQSTFRALLSALSEPGTLGTVPATVAAPEGLDLATTTALLTLCDYETAIWLPEALRDGPAGAFLRFHCGSSLVTDPWGASFAVLDPAETGTPLGAFNPGHDQFPDRSTTIFVACTALEGGVPIRLSGPGIPDTRTISPTGLRSGFWREVTDNAALYPLGVDLVLTHGACLVGLPRSTRISEFA